MAVFDEWLANYAEPGAEERKEKEREWQTFKELCESHANKHSYGKSPSAQELKRARNDLVEGQRLLTELLSRRRSNGQQSFSSINFPITSFTAVFGGPGLHGYGRHTIESAESSSATSTTASTRISCVDIDGLEGVVELIGDSKTVKLGIVDPAQIQIHYDRDKETATETVKQSQPMPTLTNLWNRAAVENDSLKHKRDGTKCDDVDVDGADADADAADNGDDPSWTCTACTFIHTDEAKRCFLACEVCSSERTDGSTRTSNEASATAKACPERSFPRDTSMLATSSSKQAETKPKQSQSQSPSSWGCLRAPSQKDIYGPRKRRKGLDVPPPMMDYIIVLDFEWTADNKKRMDPVAEIIQFPSVALRLFEGTKDIEQSFEVELSIAHESCNNALTIPLDLRSPPRIPSRRDAFCVSIFDSFVRPTLNPVLTKFSMELTAITQEMVDDSPTIDVVLVQYMSWLRSLGLVDDAGNRVGNWTFATWGDVDLMSTLREYNCSWIHI